MTDNGRDLVQEQILVVAKGSGESKWFTVGEDLEALENDVDEFVKRHEAEEFFVEDADNLFLDILPNVNNNLGDYVEIIKGCEINGDGPYRAYRYLFTNDGLEDYEERYMGMFLDSKEALEQEFEVVIESFEKWKDEQGNMGYVFKLDYDDLLHYSDWVEEDGYFFYNH